MTAPTTINGAMMTDELISLLREIRPSFSDAGSRDVDTRRKQNQIDSAIELLSASKPAAPVQSREPFGYAPLPEYEQAIDGQYKRSCVTVSRKPGGAFQIPLYCAPQSCGDAEQAEGARFGAVELILRDVCEDDPADPDLNDTVCIDISDLKTIVERHIGTQSTIEWAVGRWNAEVSSRPLVNVHRRSLDDTWRQVIRHLGGDDAALLGPCHSELLAAAPLPHNAEQADEAVTDGFEVALNALAEYQHNWDTGLPAEYANPERIAMECAVEAVREALNDARDAARAKDRK